MSKLTRIAFFALAALLILSFFQPKEEEQSTDDVVIQGETELAIGKIVTLSVLNNTEQKIVIPSNCPENPLEVEQYVNGEWITRSAETAKENCDSKDITLDAGESQVINYAPWNPELFDEKGRYRISLNVDIDEKEKTFTKEIEISSRSIFSAFWEEVFHKPILNTLVYFTSVLPGNSLGWAIVLLTLLVKLILLVPNHKMAKSQKMMQKVQPELEAIKKKYASDPQVQAAKTMEVWKKYKVNPLNNCLPLLIQLPIMLALFYVIKNGIIGINPQQLYGSLAQFDLSQIQTNFLGVINLEKIYPVSIPIVIGLLQFFHTRLTMGRTLKAQSSGNEASAMMGKLMMYALPVLLAIFAATLPAAVSIYWGINTLFGIGQQTVVNRSKD